MVNQEHIALLKRGFEVWNQWWTENNCDLELDLRGANLRRYDLCHYILMNADLSGANLIDSTLSGAELNGVNFCGASLSGADLSGADLRGANFGEATLNVTNLRESNLTLVNFMEADLKFSSFMKADLRGADLRGADLGGACLDGADLSGANLSGADLSGADLNGADLVDANLSGANLYGADLNGVQLIGTNFNEACLSGADLSGAIMLEADLRGLYARFSIVDGKTLINNCIINHDTDFSNVGLDSGRIEGRLKALLKRNVRKHYWEGSTYTFKNWSPRQNQLIDSKLEEPIAHKGKYERRWWFRLAWPFWFVSDYGNSTTRLVVSFVVTSVFFAFLYLIPLPTPEWGFWQIFEFDHPYVDGLNDHENMSFRMLFLRAFYLSVVTMTTLGFGDITAHPLSSEGHLLVMTQVVIGYILLGALITRLAILFQDVA